MVSDIPAGDGKTANLFFTVYSAQMNGVGIERVVGPETGQRFPARESLESDIPAGYAKTANLF